MSTLNLLYKREYKINDSIKIIIPSVGEIVDNEDDYYSLITVLTAMPIDLMVPLDEAGIDYTQINDYELFLIMSEGIKKQDTHLVFGDLDFTKFEISVNPHNGSLVLRDEVNDITIDRSIYVQISAVLRKIHHLKKNRRKPANQEAKEYMMRRAREKMRRNKNKTQESQLEPLIIALVNTEQYKYDFEGTRELSIYQFNESIRQIIHKVDYDNRMYGIYAGTVNAKELSQKELNWLAHD